MNIFPTQQTNGQAQLSLLDYWYIVQKRKRIAITFFLIAFCSTALYTLIHPKIYRATTRILIERSNQNIVSFNNIFPVETAGIDYYPTQHKVLKSRTIGRQVIDALGLAPQFAWSNDPVGSFLHQIDVDPVRQSRLVDVSAHSTNPKQAADIANAIVKFYIQQGLANKLQMTHQASEWLKEKSEDIRARLTESELEFEAIKLKKDLVDLEERYLPKHPKMIRAKARIKAIEQELGREVVNHIPLGEMPVLYTQLEREVESNRKIYETMLSRLKETVASEGIVDTNVVVIDRAEVPTRPVAPRVLLNLFLGVLLGGLGSIGLCLVFESLDNTVKSFEDVENIIELPFLGIVTRWPAKQNELVVQNDPMSGVSEAFRAIRTNLLFSSPDHPLQTLMVTSPHAGEGKTVVSCNLAIALAHSGARVILIDADMRKPRLNRIFEQTTAIGLSHALTDSGNFSDFIQKTQIENLSVVFCGLIPPRPSELIGSKKMQAFITKLKEHFDYIIFDTSPFMAVTDPVILSASVDGTIIVTRYNKTSKDIVASGKRKFVDVKAKLVGVIINDYDISQERYRYSSFTYDSHSGYTDKLTSSIEAGNLISKQIPIRK